MFELTLSDSIENQKYFSKFKSMLIAENGKKSAVYICHNSFGRTYLAIAVEDAQKEYIKTKVLDFIFDIIIKTYKFNYFKEQLLMLSQSVLIEPFLKAIVIFDADNDFELIKNEIDFGSEIVIDSFFYFKLQSLKQRWQKTANIIIKNGITQSESSMIQVIKYLAEVSEKLSILATVRIFEDKIKLENYKGTKSFKNNFDGLSRFFCEIICLNPQRINIIKNIEECSSDSISQILMEIFGEKIYLQN